MEEKEEGLNFEDWVRYKLNQLEALNRKIIALLKKEE